jgi:hypothetical protein
MGEATSVTMATSMEPAVRWLQTMGHNYEADYNGRKAMGTGTSGRVRRVYTTTVAEGRPRIVWQKKSSGYLH